MRERAVGQRIMMYWHIDDSFYPATITAFDELHYRHRVEHDDGDIEPAVKLWEAQVNLEVCTLIQSFLCTTRRLSHPTVYYFTGGTQYRPDTFTYRLTTR
jgi:hypothetical protein